eukprot:m.51549 g.51549  ORF g.51549 m.51549 type:complete len:1340 (+) comp7317_c0_seq1:341-4360(+)
MDGGGAGPAMEAGVRPTTAATRTRTQSAGQLQKAMSMHRSLGGSGGVMHEGEGGGGDPRLLHFVHMVGELVGDGEGPNDPIMSTMAKQMLVEDMDISLHQVRQLAMWVHEVESLVEERDATKAASRQTSEESEGGDVFLEGGEAAKPLGGVVVYGGIAMDIISEVDHFPKANSTLEALSFRTSPGGKGANAAVACGRLGTPCYAVGCIGDDDFGRTLVKQLSKCVKTNGVKVVRDAGTGFALIVTALDTRQKTNTICKGANQQVGTDDLDRLKLVMDTHPEIGIMLITLDAGDRKGVAMSNVAELGRKADKLVILRASPLDEAQGISTPLLDNSHVVIVTTGEAAIALRTGPDAHNKKTQHPTSLSSLQQCAAAAKALLHRSTTPVAVIVSSGMGVTCRVSLSRARQLAHPVLHTDAAGAYCSETADGDEYTITLPPFRGPVVDVVGAVDALTGGIAAALARGVSLSHALVWGTACTARSVSEAGAQDSMPSMSSLNGFLRMENVHVSTGDDGGDPLLWPADKPMVGAQLRELEEHLHMGDTDAFRAAIENLKTQCRRSTEPGRIVSEPVDFQGHTLLHLAVLYGDLKSVLILLSAGADSSVSDHYGMTPLERCDKEYRAARKSVQHKFAMIKFCLVCVDQVNRVIEKASATDRTASGDPLSHSHAAFGGDPSPLLGPEGRQSVLSSGRSRSTSMAESAVRRTQTPTTVLYDCGRALSPLLNQSWGHSLLAMMTLPMDESLGCEQHKDDLHAVCHHLILQVLRDGAVRDIALKTMAETVLRNSGTKFSHGLAYSGNDEVMRALYGSAVERGSTPTDQYEDDVEGEDVVIDLDRAPPPPTPLAERAGAQFVKDHMQGGHHDTDMEGRTLLHYAMIGENLPMCVTLLNWGHSQFVRDNQGKIPRAYSQKSSFVEEVKKLQLETDAFVSVGHTLATDKAITLLVDEARKVHLQLWWDKGGKAASGLGIRPGEPWTAEIDKAMKKCKICIVVLTKKWLDSLYCNGEIKCALSYNKEIIAIMPPLPVEERASIADIPETSDIYAALTHRQVFDFSNATNEEFVLGLPRVFEVVESVKPSFQHDPERDSDPLLHDSVSWISDIIKPSTVGARWDADKYVFLLCANVAEDATETMFTRLLARELVESGVPVVVGFRPMNNVRDEDYMKCLHQHVDSCTFLVLVIQESSNFQFFSRVVQEASVGNTRVIMVPYTRLSEQQDSGFGYTAHLASPSTSCFTDWMGSGIGLTQSSPIFREGFRDFLVKLDELQGDSANLTNNEERRRMSFEVPRPPPVRSGFSITKSASDVSFPTMHPMRRSRHHAHGRHRTSLPAVVGRSASASSSILE